MSRKSFFTSLEIIICALALAAALVSARALPWAALALWGTWLARRIVNGRFSVRTPVDWAIAGLALMLPVTLWATAFPEISRPQVFRILVGVGVYYAIVNWARERRQVNLLLLGIYLGVLGLSLFAPFSVTWLSKFTFISQKLVNLAPVVSDVVHPNVMAGSLVLLVSVGLAVFVFAGRRLSWPMFILAGISSLCGLAVLAMTQSRGGWLAMGVVLVLLPVLRWRWAGRVLLAGLAGGIVLALFVDIRPVLNFVVANPQISRGMDGRLEVWSRAIYMIQDFPFTGIGIGAFTAVADLLYPFFLAPPGTIQHAHNLLLQIAVDLGIPGLICWLAIWLNVVIISWQVYRAGKAGGDGLLAGLGAGLLVCQIAILAHGMLDAVTWGMVRSAPLVWAVWGIAAAAGNLQRQPPPDVSAPEEPAVS